MDCLLNCVLEWGYRHALGPFWNRKSRQKMQVSDDLALEMQL